MNLMQEVAVQLHDWQGSVQQQVIDAEFPDENIRLGIYHNAYRLRLAEALRSNYPALHQSLGDEDFGVLAQYYLAAHPSQYPSIRWFGDKVAEFLSQQLPYTRAPFLAELARFEWALRHTVDAADAERVTVEQLQIIASEDWAQLQFALHPSVTLLSFAWNAPQLCQSLTEEGEQSMVEPARQAAQWMVYRQADLMCSWRSQATLENNALELLQQGKTFSDLCEYLADATQAAGLLRTWVEEGILVLR